MARRTAAEPAETLPPLYDDEGEIAETAHAMASPLGMATQAAPLFARAAMDWTIRVQSMNGETHRWQDEGHLPPLATEDDIVKAWPRAGAFRVQAVDASGKPAGEPRTIEISPTHRKLQQILAGAGAGGGGAVGGAVGTPGATSESALLEMMKEQLKLLNEQREKERVEAREREDRLMEQVKFKEAQAAAMMEQAAEKHREASALVYERSAEVTKDLVAQQREGAKIALEATTGSLGQILVLQQSISQATADRQAADALRQMEAMRLASEERIKAAELAAAQQQQAHEARLASEREYAEQRRREEADRAEREAQRSRDHMEILVRINKEAAAEREARADKLDEMREKADPLGALTTLVTTAATLAGTFGFDLKDVISGGTAAVKMSGWQELVKTGLETLKEVAVAARSQGVGGEVGGDDEEDEDEQMVTIALADGRTVQVPASQIAPPPQQPQLTGPVAGGQGGGGGGAGPGYPQQPQQPYTWGGGGQGGMQPQQPPQPQYAPQPVEWAGSPPAHMMPGQPQQYAPPQQLPPPPPIGAPPGTDKSMRAVAAELVAVFESQPEDRWIGAVAAQVQTHGMPFLEYLKAKTISGALSDAGAPSDLVRRVIAVVDGSGMVPNDIPR